MERLIVLDTETTGIEPSEGHRIIEVGAVQILDRDITELEFHRYLQPNRNVGESVNIHGISDNFLKDKPQFSAIAEDFIAFVEGATLVIHNAPFDLGFLNNELRLIGFKKKIEDICDIIDTLELSKEQRPGTMHNLDALCRRFEIDASARTIHGALLDAQILAQVYLAMTGGQSNLFQEANPTEIIGEVATPIKTMSNDNNKIKVIYANDDEIKAHENYFQHS
ncbi:MAG TPA: DNA polymerase III subunit epsilon [Candidatus Thioglobus sp.]|nr:DNA polymerase III subunit epsilon [Candidatus Thioglobus sp.]HIL20493.1 DNA polymerase III subunit epsilon [Candidatus Thioglobus sp.]